MVGNLIAVRKVSGNFVTVGNCQGKILSGKMCPVQTFEFCLFAIFYF